MSKAFDKVHFTSIACRYGTFTLVLSCPCGKANWELTVWIESEPPEVLRLWIYVRLQTRSLHLYWPDPFRWPGLAWPFIGDAGYVIAWVVECWLDGHGSTCRVRLAIPKFWTLIGSTLYQCVFRQYCMCMLYWRIKKFRVPEYLALNTPPSSRSSSRLWFVHVRNEPCIEVEVDAEVFLWLLWGYIRHPLHP